MPELSDYAQHILRHANASPGPAHIIVRVTDQSGGPFATAGRCAYMRPDNQRQALDALAELIHLKYVKLQHDDGKGRKSYELTTDGRTVATTLPPPEDLV